MMNRNKQQGFTLIELIVVIVILGILAVTAAPKFMSFAGDATKGALEGIQGSIRGSMNMANAKAVVNGKEKVAASTAIGGVTMVYGYPDALATGIITGAGIDGAETATKDFIYFLGTKKVTIAQTSEVTPSDPIVVTDLEAVCHLVYTEAADADTKATIVLTNCA